MCLGLYPSILLKKSLSLIPMGKEFLLSHAHGSRFFRSQYDDLGRPSSGSFCLPMEQPVNHERSTSNCIDPSNGLGFQVNGTFGVPSMPIVVGTSPSYRSGSFGKFFFCTSGSVLTETTSSHGFWWPRKNVHFYFPTPLCSPLPFVWE